MSRLLGSVRRPWMVALFAILAATIAVLSQSLPSQAVQAPTNVTAPVIGTSGTFAVAEGKTLTATPGTWTDSPTLTYQWYRCTSQLPASSTDPTNCQLITNDTGITHRNSVSDVGFYMVVKEIATNAQGTAYTYSAATDRVRQSKTFAYTNYALCEIRSGKLYCAGLNGANSSFPYGGLVGNGTLGVAMKNWYGPVALADGTVLTDLVSVSMSNSNTCVLTLTGSVYCIGLSTTSPIFNDSASTAGRIYFTRLNNKTDGSPVTNATSVITSSNSICYTATDGFAYCYGLGSATTTYAGLVQRSAGVGMPGILQLFGNSTSSSFCATVSDGTTVGANLYCWGTNTNGILGTGDTTFRQYPTQVTANASTVGFTAISMNVHSCAIQNNGVLCWGDDQYGQQGRGATATYSSRYVPTTPNTTAGGVSFAANNGWVQVETGGDSTGVAVHSCFLNISGAVFCTGDNATYEGNNGATTQITVAKPATDFASGVTAIDLTQQGTCVQYGATGTLKCIGTNSFGQFGNGTVTASGATPVTLAGTTGVTSVLPSIATTGISGNNASGNTLSDASTWDGFPAPTLTYQWYSCTSAVTAAASVPAGCSAISGATSATYNVNSGDVGNFIAPYVTASNEVGSASRIMPAANAIGILPTVSASPSLTNPVGSLGAGVGQTFTSTPGNLTGAAPTGTQSVQWYRCYNSGVATSTVPSDCKAILGATASSYRATKAETGQYVRVADVYTSAAGTAISLSATSDQVFYSNTLASSKFNDGMCAIQLGKVYCWGRVGGPQLGEPTVNVNTLLLPMPVMNAAGSPLTDVAQIAVGGSTACAIKTDKTLWCWGTNTAGALSVGSSGTNIVATKVTTSPATPAISWAQVALGGTSSYETMCALDSTGAVWCAGAMTNGGIGSDSTTGTKLNLTKSTVLTSGIIQLTQSSGANGAFSVTFCALRNTGAVVCWGNAAATGLMGDGGATPSRPSSLYTPYLLDSGVNYIDLAATVGCALKSGSLICWGSNANTFILNSAGFNGYIFSPIPLNQTTFDTTKGIVEFSTNTVTGSTNRICVLTYLGAVACNGGNSDGGLNLADTGTHYNLSPTRWTSGVTALAQTSSINCAVVNGNVQCAGTVNSQMNLGVGTALNYDYVSGPKNVFTFWGKVGVLDNDPSSITVTISQNAVVGSVITSNLSGEAHPVPTSSYAWYQCAGSGAATSTVPSDCTAIPGATSANYTVDATDDGSNLRVAVTSTNIMGTSVAVSASVTVGTAPTAATTPAGTVTWSPLKLLTGTTLTSPVPVFTGSPSPSVATKWYRCVSAQQTWVSSATPPTGCYPVEGGTSATYTTTHGDDGFYLSAAWTAKSSAGSITYYSPTTSSAQTYANMFVANTNYAYCAIRGGRVLCWGKQNINTGTLGNSYLGTNTSTQLNPPTLAVRLANGKTLTGVISISGGQEYFCAVTYSGSAYCWGANGSGQLGDGTTTSRWTAAPVLSAAGTSLAGVTQIAAGATNTCAIASGATYCWGASTTITGSASRLYASYQVPNLAANVQQIAIGYNHACAIQGAALKCWGDNTNTKTTGDGTTLATATPATPSALFNESTFTLTQGVSNVTTGYQTTCAVRLGKTWCFGSTTAGTNFSGSVASTILPATQQADGTEVLSSDTVQVSSASGAAALASSALCATKLSGAVYCVGPTNTGVGNASGVASSPTLATNLASGVTELSVGGYETCAIKAGALYCAGTNTNAVLLNGTTTASLVHVPVTAFSDSLGISESATVAGTASVSGYTVAGGTITAVNSDYQGSGAWQGVPTPTMTTQWYVCTNSGSTSATLPADCTVISGETNQTYVIPSDQTGKYYRAAVTGTNSFGTATVYTAAAGPVGEAPLAGTLASIGAPSGPVLTTSNTITGTPGTVTSSLPITTTNQWYRCSSAGTATSTLPAGCVPIPGATSTTYRPATSDISAYVRFATLGTSSAGQAGTWSDTSPMVRQGNLVAVADSATCAIRTGRVYCWGSNTSNGLLGIGTTSGTVPNSADATPVLTAANTILENVVSISGLHDHFCAITSGGGVYCWGYNGVLYQLGTGASATSYTYATPPANAADATSFTSGVVGIAMSTSATCVWRTSGSAYCWGDGGSSSSHGLSGAVTVPTMPTGLSSGVTKIALASDGGCAIKNGSLLCWGAGPGIGSAVGHESSNVSSPTPRSSITSTDFQDITADNKSLCMLRNYSVTCLGSNTFAGIGSGTHVGMYSFAPFQSTGEISTSTVSLYSANQYSSGHCAVIASGSMYCWGLSVNGSLPGIPGDSSGYIDSPVLSPHTGVYSLAINAIGTLSTSTTCFVNSAGLNCGGNNGNYNLGNGVNTSSLGSSSSAASISAVNGFSRFLGSDYVAPTFSPLPAMAGGSTFVGNTFTGSYGVFGYPVPTSSQKWMRCSRVGTATTTAPSDCTDLAGATTSSYTLVSADKNYQIRYVATATNSVATTTQYTATSNPVSSLTSLNISRPSGSGSVLTQGSVLTRADVAWKSSLPVTITKGWLRCGNIGTISYSSIPSQCSVISGATSASYTVGESDIGNFIASFEMATSASGSTYAISPTSSFVMGTLSTIAVGENGTCAIKSGNVYCAGDNQYGSLGRGVTTQTTTPFTPSQVLTAAATPLTKVISVTATKYSATFCAITNSAQLYCWGYDTSKVITDAGGNQSYAKQMLGGARVAYAALMGTASAACAIGEGASGGKGGALYCWGANNSPGFVGNGGISGSYVTQTSKTILATGVTALELGPLSSCYVKGGGLYCWGGLYTRKPVPLAADSNVPVAISALSSGVTRVAIGSGNGCAIQNGGVVCWGDNSNGALGNGTTNPGSITPTAVGNANDGTSLSSGVVNIYSNGDNNSGTTDRFCAVKDTGALYCWGNGTSGLALTGASTSTISTPQAITSFSSGVTQVSMGRNSSCLLKSGTLYCAGASTASNYGANLHEAVSYETSPVSVTGYPVATADPPAVTTATVPSVAQVGVITSVEPGVGSGSPVPTYAFAWYRCNASVTGTSVSLQSGCTAISGATSQNYTPTATDLGKFLVASVTQAGSSTVAYYSASTTAVSAGDQSVYISVPAGNVAPGGTVQLTATATSGLTDFTWSSADTAQCTVDANGLVSALLGGHCVITASQAGNGSYSAATNTVDIMVERGPQTISWNDLGDTGFSATPITLAAASNSNLTIAYASSTPLVCTISNGKLVTQSLGTCTLTADQSGNTNFFAATQVTKTFNIVQGSQTITFAGSQLDLPNATYNLAGNSDSLLALTYSTTSDASICSVSGSTLTMNAIGNCVVTASQAGTTNFAAATPVTATFRIVSTPTSDTPASISGTPTFGVSYTSTPGVWAGAGTVTVAKQWYSCTSTGDAISATGNFAANAPSDCVAISGATSGSFTPTAMEVGNNLRYAEQASNVIGGTTNYYTTFTSASATVVKQSQTITFGALNSATFGDASRTLGATSDRGLAISYASSDTSVCTISGSSLTIVGAGTCDVTASQAGNSGTLEATSVTQTLTVAKANQTITLPAFTSGVYGGVAKASGATASSGLTVTLTSADTAVCTVTGLSVNLVAHGTCSITASQTGNANYNAATDVTKSFMISKASQTITFAPTTKQKPAGDFAAGGSASSGLAVSYSSSTTSVCTVSGATVSSVGLGTCTITASQAGDSNYNAATSVTASFTIESVPVQTTAISIASAANYRFGTAITTTAGTWTGTATVAISRAWYRCDTAPSISAGTGSAAALAPSDCVLISGAFGTSYTPVAADITKFVAVAETASNTTSTGANARTTFVSAATAVEKQTQTITFGALASATYGDAAISLTASSDRSLTISYASSNTAVCTVSGATLTVVAPGTCDVTASQSGDANTLAATSVTQTLSVNKKAQTINLPAFTSGVYGGAAKVSGATATSGLTVTLTSNDTSICTVTGLAVNQLIPGTCSITATQAGDSNYLAAPSVTKTFTIAKASQTITFAPTTKQKPAGDFAAGGTASSGLTVTYVSTTNSVCTVSGSTVSPVGLGTCSITASQAGDSNYLAAPDVSSSFTIESVPVQTTAISIASAANYRFGTAITTTAGTWTGTAAITISRTWYRCDSAPSISTGTGSAAALAPSDCVLISGSTGTSYTPVAADISKFVAVAETASNTTSTGANVRTTFVSTATAVEKQTQTITFSALTAKTFGDAAFALSATSDRSLTITYASSDTSVCTVSGSTLTIVGAGSCDITASQAGNATTLSATDVVRTLTVNKKAQTITLPDFTAGVYGGANKASGATTTSGLTITLTSADTAICTVSGLSVIQVTPGTCSITASQAGDANYLAATSVTKSFTIAKAAQTITFAGGNKQKPAGDFTLAATTTSGLAISYASTTAAVCTVSGSTVTPVTLGTCTITASQAGDSNYLAATSVNASFTIESVPVQSAAVSIASAANYRFGNSVTATAGTWTGTSAITYARAWFRCDTAPSIAAGTGSSTSLKPADCAAITGATTLSYTPVAADIGKYLAIAETASNTTSTGANSRTTFVSTTTAVEKQTQTITFAALANKTYGDAAFALTATSDRSLTITYSSSDTAVCTISGSNLTVLKPGTCDVTASQAGDATTLAATDVVRTLTVVKANQTVTLNNLAAIDFRGTPTALVYSATSGLAVTVVSNSTSICTVSGTTVSVVAVGTCSITASQAGDANYNAATSVTKTFVISKTQDTLTFTGATKQFRSGNFTISASTLSGASVSFTSTTTSICTVSGATVTPVNHGACVITATAATDSNYTAPANINATFTIERAVEQSAVHSMSSFATYWYDQQIIYTAGTWVGSGTVSVSHNWYVCASRPTTNVVSGSTVPANCSSVTETSTGAYKPVAADIGKYVVLAETASNVTAGGTNTSTSWISAAGVVTKWAQNLTFGALADKTYGALPFTLSGVSDQGQQITYTSSNTAVCTVAGAVVSIVAAGSCDITASQAGNTTIAAATSITQTLTVNKASQTVSLGSFSDVTYSAATVTAISSATSGLSTSLVSGDISVCTISGSTISMVKAGTCSITASQAGNTNYNAATSVTKTFAIAKASQTVSFTIDAFISLGDSGALNLNGASNSGLVVTYTVSDSAVCKVQNGTLVGLAPGTCTVTATQAGDDRYNADSVARTLQVGSYALVTSMTPIGSAITNATTTGFTVTFDSAISGFTASDLSTVPAGVCTIGEPASVNGDLAVYSVALTNCAEGSVVLKVAAGSISNGAPGPMADAVGTESILIDRTFLQTASVAPQFTSPTNDTSLVYNVTFAEDVTGFATSDLTISGTGSANCVAAITGSGSTYVVTLTGCEDGTVAVSVNASSVVDLAGNAGPATARTSSTSTVDLIAPEAFDATGLPDTYSRSTDFTVEFPILAGNTYHCTLNGVELQGCDGSLVIPASSLSNGNYTVEVWATDAAGNNSTHYSSSFSIGSYAKPAAPVINAGTFARTAFNHLTINWSLAAAQSAQLPVTGLALEYSTNGTTWTAVPELAADATSYDLTMRSGSTYVFRIRALSGPFSVNASEASATASYVATYMPVITAQSTTAALLKPAAGTSITLTGTDFRDFSNTVPTATTGTAVTLTDSTGKAFSAKIVSVTATSVRFTVPASSKVGAATVKVMVGSGVYQRTSATRAIKIVAAKVAQVITFTAPASTRVGDADTQLTATMDSLITPTFQIEPGSIGICTVSANGLLHPIKGGACSYKVLAVAGDAFTAFTSTAYTTTVNKLNVSISFDLPADLTSAFNQDGKLLVNPNLYQLTAVADVAVPNTTVSVTSAPETVCFVDGELKLHVISIGTCTITALAENDFYRTQIPVTRIFEIVKSVQTLTYIAPGTTLGNISAPQATDSVAGFQMVATLDSGMTPTFEVTDSNICTVDPSGMVSWVSDLVKSPNDVCEIKISQAGDANFYAIEPRVVRFGGTHVAPLPPVGGYVREPDGSLAVGRTGGLAASGNEGVAVVIVTGSKIAITPFSRGIYIGPITATVTIPYYIRVKNVLTYKEQLCTIKFGILKKYKAGDPNAFKVKDFKNTKACTANKDAIAWFKTGARLLPTIVVKRDRKWPTTYLAKSGSNGKGAKIWPRIKTWHLTIG